MIFTETFSVNHFTLLLLNLVCFVVDWLDHSKTLREQGIDESEIPTLRRKFFFSDQNIDARDPVQLNLLFVQVSRYCGVVVSVWDSYVGYCGVVAGVWDS